MQINQHCILLCVCMFATSVHADQIQVHIHDLECEICSQEMLSSFKEMMEVERVNPDYGSHTLEIETVKGSSLSDDKIREVARASGFRVVEISRTLGERAKKNL